MERSQAFFRRATGDIEQCEPYTKTSFAVAHKYNTQPNSVGVVATCLFGNLSTPEARERYVEPLLKNTKYIHDLLPGWCLRVYLPASASPKFVQELVDKGCEVYVMQEESKGYMGTMWRFLPAAEHKPFLSYDADMHLNDKGIWILDDLVPALNKWLKSDKPFFQRRLATINIFIPLSAGTWGAKPDKFGRAPVPDIQDRMEKYCGSEFGCDEAFLNKEIWPEFKSKGSYSVSNNFERAVLIAGLLAIIALIIFIIRHRASLSHRGGR